MPEVWEKRNELLHEAIAGVFRTDAKHDDPDDMPARGLLVGWVLVAEHAGVDGERYLSLSTCNDTTSWTAAGMLHTALEENTPVFEEDD